MKLFPDVRIARVGGACVALFRPGAVFFRFRWHVPPRVLARTREGYVRFHA